MYEVFDPARTMRAIKAIEWASWLKEAYPEWRVDKYVGENRVVLRCGPWRLKINRTTKNQVGKMYMGDERG